MAWGARYVSQRLACLTRHVSPFSVPPSSVHPVGAWTTASEPAGDTVRYGQVSGKAVTQALRSTPSLVGSKMSEETSSEQSSVRDGAGYDEVYQRGHESGDDFSLSSEDESLIQSCDEEGGDDDGVIRKGGGDDARESGSNRGSSGGENSESTSGGSGDDRPFILPKEWTVNHFLPSMTDKVFNLLRARYQIPDDIPIRLPLEKERCYSEKTADVGMYDAMFAAGLRLPLTALHRQLANYLGVSVSQIAPNAWRVFIGSEILWGSLSGGHRQLTLDEFFWCYRPHQIASSRGIYHFSARKKELRLVSDMPDSNRKWKGRYFFVEGTNWVCRQEEWGSIPQGFDNTWAHVRESGRHHQPCT
ncbi:hypothetical protein SO802_017660 [Lithocarpus litseifolius]|uniref:Uncharacterized protein n=1 Tax=Lithocarpus litseifolius TaxID=425828 RepID=A0AAW2CL02_9ROSI